MNPVNPQIRALETRLASMEVKLGRLQHLVDQLAADNQQFRLRPPSATELQAEIVRPDWLRLPAAMAYTGFSRGFLYRLLYDNKIRSIVIKTDKTNIKGIRLISRASLDKYIIDHCEEPNEQ
jgi:hypothetical protein